MIGTSLHHNNWILNLSTWGTSIIYYTRNERGPTIILQQNQRATSGATQPERDRDRDRQIEIATERPSRKLIDTNYHTHLRLQHARSKTVLADPRRKDIQHTRLHLHLQAHLSSKPYALIYNDIYILQTNHHLHPLPWNPVTNFWIVFQWINLICRCWESSSNSWTRNLGNTIIILT